MNSKTILMLMVCALLIPLRGAISAVLVYPMEVTIDKSLSHEVKVTSQDDTVKFVRIYVKKIENPGTKKEKEISADFSQSDSLLVTPQKLIIPPGGERTIKIVSLEQPKQEKTWRVYVEEVSESDYSNRKVERSINANVGVNITWGILVHVSPISKNISLSLDKTDGKIENTGTVSVKLLSLGRCDNERKCVWHDIGKTTVYPNQKTESLNMAIRNDLNYKVKVLTIGNNETTKVVDLQ